MMKMDSFYPSGTGDVPLEMAPIGEWKTYKFDLSDLTRHPGSSLNLQNVNTPLVIFPDWDNQEVSYCEWITLSSNVKALRSRNAPR